MDYKWNFTPEKSDRIPQLHERVAQKVYDFMTSNGELYIKFGYVMHQHTDISKTTSSIYPIQTSNWCQPRRTPKPMQVKFASLFDDAPDTILCREENAVPSASIA